MTQEEYDRIRRGFVGIMAILLWIVSNNFSIAGFNFQVKGMWWAGLILSLTITALELVFMSSLNSKNKNMTLWIFGVLAYGYGCVSNLIGLWTLMGNTNLDGIFDNFITFGFVGFLSLMGETAPEGLLLYALGIGTEGDFFRSLLGLGTKGSSGGNSQSQNRQDNNQPKKSSYPPIQPPPKNQQKGNQQNNSYPRNPYPNLEKEQFEQRS